MHFLRWVSPAVLGLIVPELWQDAFAWLRESGYQPYAQALCVCWVVFVVADSLPVATATRQRRSYQVISTIVVMLLCGAAWWFLVGRTKEEPIQPAPVQPAKVPDSIRLKYSSVQSIQFMSPDVEGFGKRQQTINLDSVGTLHLMFGNLASVRLILPQGVPMKIEKPKADVTYPGGVQFPNAGKGMEISGVVEIRGPQQHFTFTREQRSTEMSVAGRTFIVSLNDIKDHSPAKGISIEYVFGITEK